MRVVMTLFVRNEADIIGELLRYHLNLGVAAFAVVDNGSTDGTTDILRRHERAGQVHLTIEPRDVSQEETVTHLARIAATELAADWVIVSDGDEFWTPHRGTIPETFAGVDAGRVLAPWWHFPPRPREEPWWQRMTARLLAPQQPWFDPHVKVAFRADPNVTVAGGNHDAAVKHRGSVSGLIDVLHFPYRSPAQFRRKMARWYELLAAGDLQERHELAQHDPERAYRRLVVSDWKLRLGLRRGIYAIDERVSDALDTPHQAVQPPSATRFAPVT